MEQKKLTFNCPLCKDTYLVKVDGEDEELNTYRPCDCTKDIDRDRRITTADIPKEFKDLTVSSFNIDFYKSKEERAVAITAKTMCINYIKNFQTMREGAKGLYLYSYAKGSGKTRMAVSLANALVKHKRVDVKFTSAIRILEEIRATYNKKSTKDESALLREIRNVYVIIFDDIGTEQPTNWVNEKFYSILNERMIANKITMFTSNCPVEELKLDDRIKNRIERMAIPVKFPEESVRSYLSQMENEEFQLLLLGGKNQ